MDASVGERLLDAALGLSSGSTGAARSDCNIDRLCSGPYDVLSGWSAWLIHRPVRPLRAAAMAQVPTLVTSVRQTYPLRRRLSYSMS